MIRFFEKLKELAMISPPRKTDGPIYGDVLSRSLAAGIDLWVLYMIFMPMFQLLGGAFFRHVDQAAIERVNAADTVQEALAAFIETGLVNVWMLNGLVQLIILAAAVLGMQMSWKNTPGKWLLGLKVVRRHSFEEPSLWQYVRRMLGYAVAVPPLMLGIFWASFNKEHRGWHDMIAGTVVIQTRPAGWYWSQLKHGFSYLRERLGARKASQPNDTLNDQ